MDAKLLTENGWKAVTLKYRIKDNGLQRALAAYEKIDEEEHEDRLEALATASQLAGNLRRGREIAALPPVLKHLNDLVSAAESEKREITKLKSAADKAGALAQRQAAADAQDEGEEEEQADYQAKLVAAFKRLKATQNLSYQFLICDARPHCALLLAKRLTPHDKETLTAITGGSKRFLKPGICEFRDGKFAFSLDQPVTGLARKLQDSIKFFTGKRLPIVIGSESAEGDREDNPMSHASTSQEPATGTEPEPGNDESSQEEDRPGSHLTADPSRGGSEASGEPDADSQEEPQPASAAAPRASVRPPAFGRATLAGAPQVWQQTRRFIETSISQLKTAILAEFAGEDPELLAEIEQKLEKLDAVVEALDQRLADSLARAQMAPDAAARRNELKTSKGILISYIHYVKSEPLIAQIDANPFGIQINLKQMLTNSLTHMAQAMA